MSQRAFTLAEAKYVILPISLVKQLKNQKISPVALIQALKIYNIIYYFFQYTLCGERSLHGRVGGRE